MYQHHLLTTSAVNCFLALLISLFLLTSCNSAESALQGKWVQADDQRCFLGGTIARMEFFDDGTISDNLFITEYTVLEDNRVRFKAGASGASFVYDFTIQNDTLTLTNQDGCVTEYRRDQ